MRDTIAHQNAMKTPTKTSFLVGAALALSGCASSPPPATSVPAATAAARAAEPPAIGSTAGQPDAKTASLPVTYVSKDRVASAFAKGPTILLSHENFLVIAGHREEANKPAELHKKDTDIFYILDGSATFVTGGEMVDGVPEKDPDEIRAPSVKGGEPHHLQKGDVIVIPRGTPHHFTELKGPFDYFVVKVRQ
jgi:mannose-6-phosphate isomerase-like protein (cupin superfamily)